MIRHLKHLRKDDSYSNSISQSTGEKIDVYWNPDFENWVIFKNGSLCFELPHGRSLNTSAVKERIIKIKYHWDEKNSKRIDEELAEKKKKYEAYVEDVCKNTYNELDKHVKEPYILTSKRGDKQIVVPTHPRKSFHFPNKEKRK